MREAAALQRGGTVAKEGQLASKMVAGERVGETVSAAQKGKNVAGAGAVDEAAAAGGSTVSRGTTRLPEVVPLKDIEICHEGIVNIEKHLATMDPDKANEIMIERLKKIASGTKKPTTVDLNFYAHELRERELMQRGMKYPEAHAQALKEYGIEHKRGYETQLYTQESIAIGDEYRRKYPERH